MLGELPQCRQHLQDRPTTQAVQHALAVAAGLYHAGATQVLQVLGGVGHGQPAQFGQALDRTLALGDVFEQVQPMRMAQGAGQLGDIDEMLLRKVGH
ncbi:hypothetical protein D3C77_705650 [compost metagenome]